MLIEKEYKNIKIYSTVETCSVKEYNNFSEFL